MAEPVFGRLITAMVTPFDEDGAVNYAQARKLAAYLVDVQGNDALVVNGTTGESPTTTVSEKQALVAEVVDEVGDRAQVIAGVGSFDTAHTISLVKNNTPAGVAGLLVVTPYYSKPPQDAIEAHFLAIADAADLPILVYDIPGRTGVPIAEKTLTRLARHENIVAVKDAKANLWESASVMANTDLAYYSGDDALTLPLLALGAVGVVGTSTHFTGAKTKQMIAAFAAGDTAGALAIYRSLLPVYRGVFATQGCMLVKAGLAHRGFAPGGMRLPLLAANEAETAEFVAILDAAGL
ncbi:MAG: 4-hydroxy-tetrahydrodipicolinate synthase [Propionibacteriaceae bacterium]|jgi:4-hydroxy-tetrahydrodipicolinate synthase|nr:4-hydroxy-tetrahydrodipicolinate synthase [Propionibacteriaceae bacterium]